MENLINTPSKKIFLVLGIARESENWKVPVKILQETLPDFEVIALDNSGMGVYHKTTVPLSVEGNLNFLKKKFDALKGDENYLLGWSFGGMVVAKWSQLYPDDMKGIMLMTTSFGSLSAPWFRLRPEVLIPVAIAIFSRGKNRETGLFNTTCKNEANREQLVNDWAEIQSQRPVKVLNILRQLYASTLFFTSSFKQKHPALIIGAPNDQLVNNRCSKKIAGYWKAAKYIESKSAGHDVFNDDAIWVSTEIKNWLKEI